MENLLEAWQEFVCGKRTKHDVQLFELNLMDNLAELHGDLTDRSYQHGPYHAFNINDPKPRHIHKANVRDRLLHHAIYRVLYPFFDRTFIDDSFSCRLGKGTHKALNRFRKFAYQVGRNHTRTCWVLKCDIKKFFANIDHAILKDILARYITNQDILWLLGRVIDSFHSGTPGIGVPLGNLTSQLFVNVYMNHFDQWIKHGYKVKHYIRYANDFALLSANRNGLANLIPNLTRFLASCLRLELHPDKVFIKTSASGVDFLGWLHFPDHRVLRTATRRRMFKKLNENSNPEKLTSYLGLLRHGNTHKLTEEILKSFSVF